MLRRARPERLLVRLVDHLAVDVDLEVHGQRHVGRVDHDLAVAAGANGRAVREGNGFFLSEPAGRTHAGSAATPEARLREARLRDVLLLPPCTVAMSKAKTRFNCSVAGV